MRNDKHLCVLGSSRDDIKDSRMQLLSRLNLLKGTNWLPKEIILSFERKNKKIKVRRNNFMRDQNTWRSVEIRMRANVI